MSANTPGPWEVACPILPPRMTRKHTNAYLTFADVQTAVACLRLSRADRRIVFSKLCAHRRALNSAFPSKRPTFIQRLKHLFS